MVAAVEERRARDGLTHTGAHQEYESLEQLVWKARGAKFREFFQLAGLKARVFKVSRLGWVRTQRTLHCSRREGKSNSP